MISHSLLFTDLWYIHVNVCKQFFHRRFWRSLGELNSLVHFLLHLRIDFIKSLGTDRFLFQQMLAENSDRVGLLPLLHFISLAITLRIAHGVTAVTIRDHLEQVGLSFCANILYGLF